MGLKFGEQMGALEMAEGMKGKFSKGELRIPRNAAKGVAEMEIARDSRRGKILCAEM